jgi:hypothetical protein
VAHAASESDTRETGVRDGARDAGFQSNSRPKPERDASGRPQATQDIRSADADEQTLRPPVIMLPPTRSKPSSNGIDRLGEEALYQGKEVGLDGPRIADRVHFILEALNEHFEIKRRMGVDLSDDVEIVLIRAKHLHQGQIMLLRHKDLQPLEVGQNPLDALFHAFWGFRDGALSKWHLKPRFLSYFATARARLFVMMVQVSISRVWVPYAMVQGSSGSANDNHFGRLVERAIYRLKKAGELLCEVRLHCASANFSNRDLKLSRSMFMR